MPRVVPLDGAAAASPLPVRARVGAAAMAACRTLVLLAVLVAAGAAALVALAVAHDAPLAAALAAAAQRAAVQRPHLARYVRVVPASAGAAPCLFVGRFRTPLCLLAAVAPTDVVAPVAVELPACAPVEPAPAAAEKAVEAEEEAWLIPASGDGGCATCGIEHLAT